MSNEEFTSSLDTALSGIEKANDALINAKVNAFNVINERIDTINGEYKQYIDKMCKIYYNGRFIVGYFSGFFCSAYEHEPKYYKILAGLHRVNNGNRVSKNMYAAYLLPKYEEITKIEIV